METVFRVYYDHAAHSAAVVQCPKDARYADFGPVESTCVDEFATEAEAEQRVKELTRCDARERGVYCYTHNPGVAMSEDNRDTRTYIKHGEDSVEHIPSGIKAEIIKSKLVLSGPGFRSELTAPEAREVIFSLLKLNEKIELSDRDIHLLPSRDFATRGDRFLGSSSSRSGSYDPDAIGGSYSMCWYEAFEDSTGEQYKVYCSDGVYGGRGPYKEY